MPTTEQPIARYAAVLLQIATTLVAAFVILPADTFGSYASGIPASLGLLAVALGAVLTYAVPLLGARESSILKVAIPVAAGLVAVLIDFIAAGDFTPTAIGFLILAALNGIATKVGVEIRKDSLPLVA
jgi:hypothetical protein